MLTFPGLPGLIRLCSRPMAMTPFLGMPNIVRPLSFSAICFHMNCFLPPQPRPADGQSAKSGVSRQGVFIVVPPPVTADSLAAIAMESNVRTI